VFGDRDSGAYLLKFSWTKIVRHQLVKSAASPDDPALTDYWARRRRTGPPPPLDKATRHLLQVQRGRCPHCRGLLLHADDQPRSPREWEQWLTTTRKAIIKQHIVYRDHGTPDRLRIRLTHAHCQRRYLAAGTGQTALLPAREPPRLA
jgi:RNA-directed DNA polymerase